MACFFDWEMWDVRCASDADLLSTIAVLLVATVLVGAFVLLLCPPPRQQEGNATNLKDVKND